LPHADNQKRGGATHPPLYRCATSYKLVLTNIGTLGNHWEYPREPFVGYEIITTYTDETCDNNWGVLYGTHRNLGVTETTETENRPNKKDLLIHQQTNERGSFGDHQQQV